MLSFQIRAPGGNWFFLQVKQIDHTSEFSQDDRDHMSDTQSVESRGGRSDFEGDPDPELAPASEPVPAITGHLESLSASFEWLASVDLESVFSALVS